MWSGNKKFNCKIYKLYTHKNKFYALKAIWLYFAYELEFLGKNTYIQLFIASIIFLFINCYIMYAAFLDSYQFEKQNKKLKNKKKS